MTVFTNIHDGKYDTQLGLGLNPAKQHRFQQDLESEAGLPLDFPRRSADGLYLQACDTAETLVQKELGESYGGRDRRYTPVVSHGSRRYLNEVLIQYGILFRAIIEPLLGQSIGDKINLPSPMGSNPVAELLAAQETR